MVVLERDLAFLKLPREIAYLIVNFLPWFDEHKDDEYDVENKPWRTGGTTVTTERVRVDVVGVHGRHEAVRRMRRSRVQEHLSPANPGQRCPSLSG